MDPVTDRTGEDPRQNFLLRALPAEELDRLRPLLEPVVLGFREQLYDVRQPIQALHFPTSGVCSQVALLEDQAVIEVNTIGREGVVGLPAFLGAHDSPNRVYCQIESRAYRISTADLTGFLSSDGDLHRMLHRYTQAVLVQMAQGVACNRLHSVEERMSRWILMTRDRVDADTFHLTQEFLGQMLGVRRATVSVTAATLQEAGLIRYSRGTMTVTDREGLEDAACECYRLMTDEFVRLLRV